MPTTKSTKNSQYKRSSSTSNNNNNNTHHLQAHPHHHINPSSTRATVGTPEHHTEEDPQGFQSVEGSSTNATQEALVHGVGAWTSAKLSDGRGQYARTLDFGTQNGETRR